jgi:hypothetical protein
MNQSGGQSVPQLIDEYYRLERQGFKPNEGNAIRADQVLSDLIKRDTANNIDYLERRAKLREILGSHGNADWLLAAAKDGLELANALSDDVKRTNLFAVSLVTRCYEALERSALLHRAPSCSIVPLTDPLFMWGLATQV